MNRYQNEYKDYWYDEINNAITEIGMSWVLEIITDILKDSFRIVLF